MSECCGGGKTRVIYACSGAADVGKIADETARKLAKDGFGKLTCLAAIGAHISGFVESAKAASENIVIDGCPVACGRKSFEHLGLTPRSYILTDMGLVKGQTPVTEGIINAMSKNIKEQGTKTSSGGDKPGTGGCCCG